MAASPPSFTLDNGRIRLKDAVYIYLERALAPGGPLPPGVAPRAHGLAPAGISPSGAVVAAVAPGEAVWLGFQAVDPAKPTTIRVRLDRVVPLDAVTGEEWVDALAEEPRNYVVSPPETRLAGIRQPSGEHVPFGLEKLTIISLGGLVTVELVPPATFTELTGVVPEPLDPESAYKGWRLP